MQYITMYFHITLLMTILTIIMSFEYKYISLYSNLHYISYSSIDLQIYDYKLYI